MTTERSTHRHGATIRALAVWSAITVLGLAVAAAGTSLCPTSDLGSARTLDDLVVLVAAAAIVGCAGWAWAAASVVVIEVLRGAGDRGGAARGRAGVVPTWWRRLVLVACGVAVVGAGSTLPAGAQPVVAPRSDRVGSPALGAGAIGLPPVGSAVPEALRGPDRPTTRGPRLDGLRPPDRATDGHRLRPVEATRAPAAVVVRPGDCLWALAAAQPDVEESDDSQVARRVRWLWEHNRAVIGDDPDLILPGQQLRTPTGGPDRHEEPR